MPGKWKHLWMPRLQFPGQVQAKHPVTHKYYRIGVKRIHVTVVPTSIRVLEYTGVIEKQSLSTSLTQILADIHHTNPQSPQQSCARGCMQSRRLLHALIIIFYIGPTCVAVCRLSTLHWGPGSLGSTRSSSEKHKQLTATLHGPPFTSNPWSRTGFVSQPHG